MRPILQENAIARISQESILLANQGITEVSKILALESISQDRTDLSSESYGILLLQCSKKTIVILSLLSRLLKPLESFSNAIHASAPTVKVAH